MSEFGLDDRDRIRGVVNRYIHLSEKEDGGRVRHKLTLGPDKDNGLVLGEETSLRARKDYLEFILMDLVHQFLACPRCGTTNCAVRDPDLCMAVEVMSS